MTQLSALCAVSSTPPAPAAPGSASGVDLMDDLMDDPVMATDGFAYERGAIERWFATGKQTSPKTGEPLEATLLIPCHQLRSRIREWREQQPGLRI